MENQDRPSSALEGVERTLWIPLWARAKESQKKNPLLVDRHAIEILARLAFDPAHIDKAFGEYYQLMYVVRAKLIDEEVKAFLTRWPDATVVNIGAGLDTTLERVDNGRVRWYDLDLPEVIATRRKLLLESERSRCLPKSALDPSALDDIGNPRDGLLFTACGVLVYFAERDVERLFASLASRFPGSEIVFDCPSKFFAYSGNWFVVWRSGVGGGALMKWGRKSASEIAKWDERIEVVDEYPWFSRIQMDETWSKSTVYSMRRADRMRGMNIFHLRFRRGIE